MKTTLGMALAVATVPLVAPGTLGGAQAVPRSPSTAAALQSLQCSWEGVVEGQEKKGKVSITIKGNSLQYQGLKPTERYDATFTLPAGTNPQQLHATITYGPVTSIGSPVFAIFKIENGKLILAGLPPSAVQSPTPGQVPGFEDNPLFRYDLEKVQPMRRAPQ